MCGPDEDFARKLNQALLDQGVTTFLFKEDAELGAPLYEVMHKGVNEYDRVILICSQASLVRPGVLNEIKETLAREARDGDAWYLIPISLDDFVYKKWDPKNPSLATKIRDRVVGDFSDPGKFADNVGRLVKALIRKSSGAANV